MSQGRLGKRSALLVAIIVATFASAATSSGQYQGNHQHCSNRLEHALEHMLRRNRMKSGSRTYLELTPYSVYQSLYGEQEDAVDDQVNEKLDSFYDKFTANDGTTSGKNLPINKVEVADLRVRLPQDSRWVLVDKCQFSAGNRTLDTRLMFPDLTISGKIILHPLRGRCNMILRLRRAGIEFRTIPLTSNDDSRRSGVASVRTDSHFSEPGFLSVFAHGCRGPSGQKFRQNSKHRLIKKASSYDDGARYLNLRDRDPDFSHRGYDSRSIDTQEDYMNFDDNILETNSGHPGSEHARTFEEIFRPLLGHKQYHHPNPHRYPSANQWHNAETAADSDEVGEALTRELEQLFSMGVRGLLTTYMQKALQPAIKETLMENMGYTLSYG